MSSRVVHLPPGLASVGRYRRAWLRGDLTAAVAVTALMIPHGMAYAELAGVPAVTGLYTTVAAVLTYAVFGPSRFLLLGPDSSLAPLIAAAIALVVTDGDPAEAIAAAGVLALMTGGLCLLAGATRLGTISELLSRPVQLGYLNGLAIVMVVSQLPKLMGFSVPGDTPLEQVVDIVRAVDDGSVNGTATVLGVATLAVIVGLGRIAPATPGVLVGVVGATVVTWAFDLTDRGVQVVGQLPSGFPTPSIPTVDGEVVRTLAIASIGLAWVTLTDTVALSRGFAARTGDRVDPNSEIVALGLSNVSAGLVQGFPVSASTSRTTTAFASGGKTQLVGVISAGLILALLVAGGGLVEYLPSTALAAVVIAAGLALFDAEQVRWLYRVRPTEFWLSIATTVGVVLFGVLTGVLIAVVLSLGNFVRRMWRPYDAVLGRIDRRKGYHDLDRHPEGEEIPGLALFRFDAPLFFANAEHFERRVRAVLDERDERAEPTKRIVIVAEPITDIDTSAAAVLEQVFDELDRRGIELAFAELKGPVKDRLRAYGLYDRIGDDRFHPTVGHAVSRYVRQHDVDWVNWDERT